MSPVRTRRSRVLSPRESLTVSTVKQHWSPRGGFLLQGTPRSLSAWKSAEAHGKTPHQVGRTDRWTEDKRKPRLSPDGRAETPAERVASRLTGPAPQRGGGSQPGAGRTLGAAAAAA